METPIFDANGPLTFSIYIKVVQIIRRELQKNSETMSCVVICGLLIKVFLDQ